MKSASMSEKGASNISRRGTITTSSPGCVSKTGAVLWHLNSSRARRFTRFRRTAAPNLRLAATPNRGCVQEFGTTMTVMNRALTRVPSEYARSNSGRRRIRSRGANPCAAGIYLAFVGHRQTFSSLGPPSLQHNSAVLGSHSDPESMGLLPAPGIRLKRALSLHARPALMKFRPFLS